ncbi:hypothetical protein RHSIM_Rhsim04G0017200 [Rhododendron simsii]|uniref:Disease resistance R13L4/SHOC-2-like LRR domain-containing protein n=1 Tax=Rhododendron simsii TaxID=118357 RepID=A0A834GZY2_RHOSS|nr:hypothetical protein RHSIM_Rhsim04G0017200 [Rhododendron simsii]
MDSIGLSLTPVQASSCLTELYLKDCNLSCLSEEIGNLISLRTLDLTQNNLSTLPDGICNLTRLKHLDLEANNVSNLPSGIGSLTSLEELVLSRNSLCTLPDTIGKLSCLKGLLVEYNNLSTLPDGICNLTRLKHLDLKANNVSNLPSGIGSLTSLESLILTRNSLCTLPDTIGKLSCLKNLFVGNNKLSHLPSEIGDLDSLRWLELECNNGFRALPESISKLVYLERLFLGYNISLRSLPKLTLTTTVSAESCPSLESPPLELDQLGRHADYSGSNKLVENNYLTSLLKQLPKSKGLSKLKDVVDIILPAGEEELRIWFPYHDGRGPNVSFVVPPSPSVNQKILGWILRFVVCAPRGTYLHQPWVSIKGVICNKIPWHHVASRIVYPPEVDHVWLMYIPQGHRGLQLEGGDEVEIPMYLASNVPMSIAIEVTHPNTYVKKWAIDLIYEGDEIHKANDTWWQVAYNIQL